MAELGFTGEGAAATARLEIGDRCPAAARPRLPPGPALGTALRAARAFGRPIVSIVIPVFNKVDLTRQCLESLIQNTPGELFEVVVVDNASSDATPELLAGLGGDVAVITNQSNQGFVVACNQGAAAARGKYLLFLNNDTAPQPGWLEELVAAAEDEPLVGAVGSKLVYPDGNLQEAGGIVFSDGSGWNYGKGDDPERPDYNEACEVDYCSGASLLVRREIFDRLGGFDLRYAPAYYEDTDLCFGVRSLGFQVCYCPASVVVHHEGATAGTDRSSGFKRFQEVNREKFRQKWGKELLSQPEPPSVTGRIPRTASRQRVLAASAEKASALVVDPFMPLFDRASGSLRLFRLIEMLRREGCHVTFVARNAQGQHRYRRPLQDMGVRVFAGDPERMALLNVYIPGPRVDFGQILGERHFDLAWLSFHYIADQYLPLLRALSPRTLVVADTVDVHYLRETREAELRGDRGALQQARRTRDRELAIYRRADLVVTVTGADRAELEQRGLRTPVVVIPNVHEVHAAPAPGFEPRRGLVFVGSFAHAPNVDAVAWLAGEILPRIRERAPDVPLTIVGPHPPEAVAALAGPGVAVTGWVPDTAPFLDAARVSVAPLRFGAGMKGKIGEALGRGLPVVTTSVGAEGMGLRHEESALIADTPEAFADCVLRLHADPFLWASLSRRGREMVGSRYSPEVVAASLRVILDVARQHARGPARGAARAG
jgi:GT2 family glycosyltransferase/glycosyltransferase involved in cell wall biosynthesis